MASMFNGLARLFGVFADEILFGNRPRSGAMRTSEGLSTDAAVSAAQAAAILPWPLTALQCAGRFQIFARAR